MKTLFDSTKFEVWLQIYDRDGSLRHYSAESASYSKPLYYSALCGFYDLVEYFVKKHPQLVNNIGGAHDYPLVAALHGGHIRVAELLFQHGAAVEVQGRFAGTPLHRAVGWSNDVSVGAVRFLLEHGADTNARQQDLSTPLHLAVARGYFEVVRVLLDCGAHVNAEDYRSRTPLHQLLEAGDYSEDRFGVAQLLVQHGADVNARAGSHETPLHLASHLPELRLARMFLEHGADASVNAADNQGRTPLHRVLWAGDHRPDADRFGVAQLLIERGADVNARDKYHQTPLHPASYFVELKFVRMLLDHGANVNTEGNRGLTPLHRVWRAKGHPDKDRFGVAQLLMERGANVNARDQDHETPLHLASRLVSLDGAWILLKYGANLNAENSKCKTPSQLSRESIREEMKKSPSDNSIGRSWRAKCVALMGLLYG
ncbi:ankyrin repeat-containing domain protein [Lactarius hatsudake]|nr:ankyrin repeat-containing domain protein [Lactarius hatsudake]